MSKKHPSKVSFRRFIRFLKQLLGLVLLALELIRRLNELLRQE
jgi:hypothetical protein